MLKILTVFLLHNFPIYKELWILLYFSFTVWDYYKGNKVDVLGASLVTKVNKVFGFKSNLPQKDILLSGESLLYTYKTGTDDFCVVCDFRLAQHDESR